MVNRFGKVDDGTTVTDFDDEEIARKITIAASLAYAEWNKHKINLLDTPGFNILPQRHARPRCGVRDAALVVVDGVAGVEVQTEKVWTFGRRVRAAARWSWSTSSTASAPASSRALESLQTGSAAPSIPVQLPIGEEKIVPRRRRPGGDEGLHLRSATAAARARKSASRRTWRSDAQGRARSAHRDGGRGQRRADGGVLRGGHAAAGGPGRRPARRRCRAARMFPLFCASAVLNIGDPT